MEDEVCMEIEPGACQLKTVIRGRLTEDGKVRLSIESDCPMVRSIGETTPEWDIYECVASPLPDNPVIRVAGECLKHPACPIPIAIIKVIESTAGMAVKKDVSMSYLSSSR